MSRMIINLRDDVAKQNFKNGDILVYDSKMKNFYCVTEQSFFDKTNTRINELSKKYDSQIKQLVEENEKLRKENMEFMIKIQESNAKLIEMVENFIGGK